MNKGFFDIEQEEPEVNGAGLELRKDRADAAAWQQVLEQAASGKAQLERDLAAGRDPQIILYRALGIIGLLTDDEQFTQRTQGNIDAIYADLAQQSLFEDNAAEARKRLRDRQTEYITKLTRNLNKQLAGCKKIETAIQNVLSCLPQNSDDTSL